MQDTVNTGTDRVYVRVDVIFDTMSYMKPTAIHWPDGRCFPIEEIISVRNAEAVDSTCTGICYTICVRGQEKRLFFERANQRFSDQVGRWYVQIPCP